MHAIYAKHRSSIPPDETMNTVVLIVSCPHSMFLFLLMEDFSRTCPVIANANNMTLAARIQATLGEHLHCPLLTKSTAGCVGCLRTCVQISVSLRPTIENAEIIPHRNFLQEGGSYTTRDSISASFFFLSTFFLEEKKSGLNDLLFVRVRNRFHRRDHFHT